MQLRTESFSVNNKQFDDDEDYHIPAVNST